MTSLCKTIRFRYIFNKRRGQAHAVQHVLISGEKQRCYPPIKQTKEKMYNLKRKSRVSMPITSAWTTTTERESSTCTFSICMNEFVIHPKNHFLAKVVYRMGCPD